LTAAVTTLERPPVDAESAGRGRLEAQRQVFSRRGVYLGITLLVLGAAGLARLTLMSLGGLVLVLALLVRAIDLEPTPVESDGHGDDLDDDPEVLVGEEDPSLAPTVAPVPTPTAEEPASTVVRFRLPAGLGAQTVHLVGEFNDWSHHAHPLERIGDWFETELRLQPGRSYRYRYLLDGARWENAWDADRYLPNDYGTDDSVVDLTAGTGPDRAS
jgi:hypothetical protein